MKTLTMLSGLLMTVVLAGCGSNEQVVRDCCYTGNTTATRLTDLPLTLEDGSTVPVGAALQGFRPLPAVGGPRYPLREVDLRMVAQREVKDIFHSYDANGNNELEQPEITVLYVREAALGMGVPVAYVGGGQPLGAIDTSPSDIMGLVSFVRSNEHRMHRQAQLVFNEMDAQAHLNRLRNGGGPDPHRLLP